MEHFIVFFNGPPYSGKDTAGKALQWPIYKLAAYIKIATHILYGDDSKRTTRDLSLEKMIEGSRQAMDQVEAKGTKDSPLLLTKNASTIATCISYLLKEPKVLGISSDADYKTYETKLRTLLTDSQPQLPLTWRRAYIWISEKVLKPLFGPEVMGKVLISDIRKNMHRYLAITDCGFSAEVKQILQAFPTATTVLIRCHRKGKTFEGDSRSYLSEQLGFTMTLDLYNDGSIAEWHDSVCTNITKLISMARAKRKQSESWVMVKTKTRAVYHDPNRDKFFPITLPCSHCGIMLLCKDAEELDDKLREIYLLGRWLLVCCKCWEQAGYRIVLQE